MVLYYIYVWPRENVSSQTFPEMKQVIICKKMLQTAHFKCKKAVNLSSSGDSSNLNAKHGTSGLTLKKMSSDICYGKLEKPLSLINSNFFYQSLNEKFSKSWF
jgi:hypothetical protein